VELAKEEKSHLNCTLERFLFGIHIQLRQPRSTTAVVIREMHVRQGHDFLLPSDIPHLMLVQNNLVSCPTPSNGF
jgi:hypothetical protein